MLLCCYWVFVGVVLLFVVIVGFVVVGCLYWVCVVILGMFVILGVYDIM